MIIALTLTSLLGPLSTTAQPPTKVYRLGFISSSVTSVSHPSLVGLRQGLSELGYEEGNNLKIEYRFGTQKELLQLAQELVRLGVDVIVAGGSEGIIAAKEVTQTIPIVMTNSGNAVREGFIASLERPGGNITGLTQISPDLAAKRLQLLKDTVPRLSQFAVLWHPLHPNTPHTFAETRAASRKLGLQLLSLEVKEPEGFDTAFATAIAHQVTALIVLRDPFTVRHRARIAELAQQNRLPAMYETRDFLEAGGLIAYGPNLVALYRQSAYYVDKILKGAKPGDLPVQRPLTFELVINLKAAQAIGLTIPQALLVQVTEVIQ
jgi:putative ABC transport system substrate-binding protein